MKTLHTLIGAVLIASASAASAAEPIALNDAQLDGITAGNDAFALFSSGTVGLAVGQVTLLETYDGSAGVAAVGNGFALSGAISNSEITAIGFDIL